MASTKKAFRDGKKRESPIIPQAKLLRLLQIISLLKEGKWTIDKLAAKVDMNKRTIYRYLHLIEAVDFPVEKDFTNRYFIITAEENGSQNQFTIEETMLLKKLIQSSVSKNPMKGALLKKLSVNSELESMPDLFIKVRNSKLVQQLSQAVHDKHQVILKCYHSANSQGIQDRLVEPFHFGDDYTTVLALDLKDKKCKQFKLDRIGEAIITDTKFKFETLHEKQSPDIFGIIGSSIHMVTLKLKMRAYLLLREEYPLALPYLEKLDDDGFQFHGPVRSFEGIGRFILGLPDEVTIINPPDFKTFIEQKLLAQSLF